MTIKAKTQKTDAQRKEERKVLVANVIKTTKEKLKGKTSYLVVPCLIVEPGIHSREEICGHPYLSTSRLSFDKELIKKSPVSSASLIQAAEESLEILNDPIMTLCIVEELQETNKNEEKLECLPIMFHKVLQKHFMGEFPQYEKNPLQNTHMNFFFDKLGGQDFIEKKLRPKI